MPNDGLTISPIEDAHVGGEATEPFLFEIDSVMGVIGTRLWPGRAVTVDRVEIPDPSREVLSWTVSSSRWELPFRRWNRGVPENIDPLFADLFSPSFDPTVDVQTSLSFFRRILRIPSRELYQRIKRLDRCLWYTLRYQPYKSSLDDQYRPNCLSPLFDVENIKPLSLPEKQLLLMGLAHLWSVDPLGAGEGTYFGYWIDQLSQISIAQWARNREEAYVLYTTARGMIDRSPSFLAWVDKYLPADFEFPPPPCQYSPKDNVASEVAGMVQGALASPFFNNAMRIPLAVEVEALEKTFDNYQRVAHIEASLGRDPIKQAITGAIAKSGRVNNLVNGPSMHQTLEPFRKDQPCSHRLGLEVPSIFNPLFILKIGEPLFDEEPSDQEKLDRVLIFLESLDGLTRGEIFALVENLPEPFKLSLLQQRSLVENVFNRTFLRSDGMIQALPLETKQQLLWRLVRLWSIDPHPFNSGKGDYFGPWIDAILKHSLPQWAVDEREAIMLYASARAMIDRSPRFLAWVKKHLPNFYIPSLYQYGRHELIVSEINGIAFRILQSPHFPENQRNKQMLQEPQPSPQESRAIRKAALVLHSHGHRAHAEVLRRNPSPAVLRRMREEGFFSGVMLMSAMNVGSPMPLETLAVL